MLIFSIPIIAIVGGIASGILKQAGRQRLVELAQQERIAAIQRGIDPSQLPPLPLEALGEGGAMLSARESDKRRAQGYLIAGLITLFAGIGVSAFLMFLDTGEQGVWAVGIIPATAGIALLLSALIVWPRGNGGVPRA